jgi:hypothetical protein
VDVAQGARHILAELRRARVIVDLRLESAEVAVRASTIATATAICTAAASATASSGVTRYSTRLRNFTDRKMLADFPGDDQRLGHFGPS